MTEKTGSFAENSSWRPLGPNETVHVLKDIIPDPEDSQATIRQMTTDAAISSVRSRKPGEVDYVLNDIYERPGNLTAPVPEEDKQETENFPDSAQPAAGDQVRQNMEKIVVETTRKIVMELAPEIIERVIREEIEKLKRDNI